MKSWHSFVVVVRPHRSLFLSSVCFQPAEMSFACFMYLVSSVIGVLVLPTATAVKLYGSVRSSEADRGNEKLIFIITKSRGVFHHQPSSHH